MRRSTAAEPECLFVDTWGWLVLADSGDPSHEAVAGMRRRYRGQGSLVTSDYVLGETFTRLFSRCPFRQARSFCMAIFQAQSNGLVAIEHITLKRFMEAWRLRLKYHDKPKVSFTDLTSFVVMKELRIRRVLTADAHFEHAQMGFELQPGTV